MPLRFGEGEVTRGKGHGQQVVRRVRRGRAAARPVIQLDQIEAFAATVRNETDLEALTAELLRVIQQTMEPESLSIVLFDRAAEERRRK